MGKAPAFQFYVKDWLGDPQLQMASSSTRGIWINALCFMWDSEVKGQITGEKNAMCRMLLCNNGDFDHFLEEAELLHFCDIERQKNVRGDEILTLINRRMFRDEKEKKLHRERQHRYEQRKIKKRTDSIYDANMTPPSSSSSSSSSSKKKKNILSDDEFLTSLKEKFTWVDFEREMAKMDAWLLANPRRKKTRRFVAKWLGNVDKPMVVKQHIEGDYPTARDVLLRQGFTMKDLK